MTIESDDFNVKAKLKELHQQNHLTDCEFIIGATKKKFRCHKLLLCMHSKFFERELYPPNWEKKKIYFPHIKLMDFDPETFRLFINYMYSGEIDINGKNGLALLNFSIKFEIEDLVFKCAKCYSKYITISNCLRILDCMTKYDNQELFEQIFTYIKTNSKEILSKPGVFNGISDTTIIKILKLPDLLITEFDLFLRIYECSKYRFQILFPSKTKIISSCNENNLLIKLEKEKKNEMELVNESSPTNNDEKENEQEKEQEDEQENKQEKEKENNQEKEKEKEKEKEREREKEKEREEMIEIEKEFFQPPTEYEKLLSKTVNKLTPYIRLELISPSSLLELATTKLISNEKILQVMTRIGYQLGKIYHQMLKKKKKRKSQPKISFLNPNFLNSHFKYNNSGIEIQKGPRSRYDYNHYKYQLKSQRNSNVQGSVQSRTYNLNLRIQFQNILPAKLSKTRYRRTRISSSSYYPSIGGGNGWFAFSESYDSNHHQNMDQKKSERIEPKPKNGIIVCMLTTVQDPLKLYDVRSSIISESDHISRVDIINDHTPTLKEIKKYDSIFLFSGFDVGFEDNIEIGNILAGYVKDGGGIVLSSYRCLVTPPQNAHYSEIKGKFAERYLPLNKGPSIIEHGSLGKVLSPNHPIMKNVKSFDGGLYSHRIETQLAKPNKSKKSDKIQLIASWDDGIPLIASRRLKKSNGPVVVLNFWPISANGYPSSCRGKYWNPDTNGNNLISNSLIFVARNKN
ncbi:pep-cterm sorting domain-containing protein [Anaeramoeba flamelloides]|uniref:Pep-cterm sorting domain-containing protein n=1 Tax=Anaeramoeba flamelloides TaxID=1746091 RepID=A0AAV7YM33_9EUKA|nr:pep-cterm sorting domain-containing protein [Anaeramoeba flamelloides]